MNKVGIGVIALVVIVGALFFFSNNAAEAPKNNELQSPSVTGAPDLPGSQVPSDEVRVTIWGHKIQNENITVPVGTTVIFENKDNFDGIPYNAHTVTTGTIDPTGQSGVPGIIPNTGSGVPDGLISESLKENGEYAYRFNKAGTVTFYVAEHPLITGEGTVTITSVEEEPVAVEDNAVTSKEETSVAPEGNVVIVNYDGNSYSPNTVTISAGDTVRFVNSGNAPMWTASNIHPTHANYPEKSARDCLGSSFDQCEVGTTYEFTFNSAGTHTYHNHVRANQGGTIIVK